MHFNQVNLLILSDWQKYLRLNLKVILKVIMAVRSVSGICHHKSKGAGLCDTDVW